MDKKTAEKVLSFARAAGAETAEVFLRSSTATSVDVKEQKVEAFERATDIGAGLRVISGGRMGFAYTTDLSDGALRSLAEEAVTNAKHAAPDEFNGLAKPGKGAYPSVNVFDPAIPKLTEDEQISRAMAMEREAFGADPRVKKIRKASVGFSESETVILSSLGLEASFRGTGGGASIEVIAEEKGESQAGWDHDAARFYAKLDIEDVGRRAARKALSLLGAKPVRSVKAPVILERSVAEELLSILASGVSAENVQKKKSLFIGKLGSEVLSPLLTICDDGLLDGGMGTAPADDEGVPRGTRTVFEKGRLMLFLHNTYTANKEGTVSTGNAVRGGFKGVPGVGVANFYIKPGALTPDELMRDTGSGFYVTEIMGAHTANAISGDFSVGATGLWIEKGRIDHPVREATIAGNILDLMRNVDAVCNDLKFSGRIGSPTLRVRELSVAGK